MATRNALLVEEIPAPCTAAEDIENDTSAYTKQASQLAALEETPNSLPPPDSNPPCGHCRQGIAPRRWENMDSVVS